MAIAGRRRVPAGFTNVTYRTVGPIASIASQPELTVFRPEQPCLPFLPTRTMTGAGMRSAPRYHRAYRTGCAAPNCCTRSREPARPLVFGCLGPIPSVLLGDCRRSSEDSPLITDHCLTTVHIVTRHAVKSMGMFIRNVHSFSFLYSSRAPLSANTLGSFTGDIAHLAQGRLPYGPEKGLLRNDVRFHVDYGQAWQGCDCGRWVGNRPRFRSRPTEGRI